MGRGAYYRNKYGNGGRRGGRGHDRRDGTHHDRSHGASRDQTSVAAASWQQLGDLLRGLHHRNYGAYHDLERVFEYHSGSDGLTFTLEFDHIQGDPYASPSRAHVTVANESAAFLIEMYNEKTRNVALCDYLTRIFAANARRCGADAQTISSS